MYVAWFNEIKKVQIAFSEEKKKFVAKTIYKENIGNAFLVGFNFTMLGNMANKRYFTCEFDHEPEERAN